MAGAGGPLAAAVVGIVVALGLGCAGSASAAGGPTTSGSGSITAGAANRAEPVDDVGPRRGPSPPMRADPLVLRPRSGNAAPPPLAATSTRPRSDSARPAGIEPPVVDATRQRPPSQRAGARPTRLRVEAAAIDVRVVATGVTDDGEMQLPGTVRRAGWYRYSAAPGADEGRTVIAAHVDTRTEGLGPFARLRQVGRSDRVVVTDRTGAEHQYRVISRRTLPRSELPVREVFARGGAHRLVLVTCGGAYDARNGYRDNVVVLAEPVP